MISKSKLLVTIALATIVSVALFALMGHQLRSQELKLAESRELGKEIIVSIADKTFCEGKTQEIQTLINNSKSCAEDYECDFINPGCPFGCLEATNRLAASRIEELVATRRRIGCHSCDYRCVDPREPIAVCENGQCKVVTLPKPEPVQPDRNAGFES